MGDEVADEMEAGLFGFFDWFIAMPGFTQFIQIQWIHSFNYSFDIGWSSILIYLHIIYSIMIFINS